jgi:hypothetical protein
MGAAACTGSVAVDTGTIEEPGGLEERLYVSGRTDTITAEGRADHAVSCRAPGDVLLDGSCNALGAVTVYEQFATGWEDPDLLASWHCGVEVDEVDALTSISVTALCLGG